MPFLSKLNLKSVLPLVPEDYPENMVDLYNAHGIKLIAIGFDGNKWPFKEIEEWQFSRALVHNMSSTSRLFDHPVFVSTRKLFWICRTDQY